MSAEVERLRTGMNAGFASLDEAIDALDPAGAEKAKAEKRVYCFEVADVDDGLGRGLLVDMKTDDGRNAIRYLDAIAIASAVLTTISAGQPSCRCAACRNRHLLIGRMAEMLTERPLHGRPR